MGRFRRESGVGKGLIEGEGARFVPPGCLDRLVRTIPKLVLPRKKRGCPGSGEERSEGLAALGGLCCHPPWSPGRKSGGPLLRGAWGSARYLVPLPDPEPPPGLQQSGVNEIVPNSRRGAHSPLPSRYRRGGEGEWLPGSGGGYTGSTFVLRGTTGSTSWHVPGSTCWGLLLKSWPVSEPVGGWGCFEAEDG